jgi:putative drug exporter of the RND superfamily
MIDRVGRWSHRWRWLVLSGWLLVVVALSVLAPARYSSSVDSGGPTDAALRLLQERFAASGGTGDVITVVVRADRGIDDPTVHARIADMLTEATLVPHIVKVVGPYDTAGAGQVSADRRIAFAVLQLDVTNYEVPAQVVDELQRLRTATNGEGIQVELGGEAVRRAETKVGNTAEIIGFLAAAVVLVVVFGSLVGVVVPIVTALLGLGLGFGLVGLVSRVITIPSFAPQLAAMIGIGVGIDYALFVVTRYRDSLGQGLRPADASAAAMATAGRAVAVAGGTVVVALAGVMVIGGDAIVGLGVAAALVVAATMLAAVILLPAVLGVVGRRIDLVRLRPRRPSAGTGAGSGWSYRWIRTVQRRPLAWAITSATILLALSVPALGLRLGTADASNGPATATSRRAYDLLSDAFGPGFNAPLVVVIDLAKVAPARRGAAVDEVRAAFHTDPGVAAASSARLNPSGDTAQFSLMARTAPQDAATDALIHRLPSEVPASVRTDGAAVYLAGRATVNADNAALLSRRLPWLFTVVIGLALLLLLVSFRSLLLPIQAALLNLLTISAAYGAVVAVFQWGWGINLLGLAGGAPIDPVLPMLMFAIAFGLSMDYQVFLLSRVREEWQRTGDNQTAVARGVGATARVITAAALIMISVFAAFMLGSDRLIKLFGFSLAVPIMLDVVLIRLILVPAIMTMSGRANWYLPGRLGRLRPATTAEPVHAPAMNAGMPAVPEEHPITLIAQWR